MVMDPRLKGFIDEEGFKFNDEIASDQDLMNLLNPKEPNLDQNKIMGLAPSSSSRIISPEEEEDCPEECDFSDVVLKYINQMLMEEDMEDQNCMFQESSALQAAEKPFYEILGEKYPPSVDTHHNNTENQVDNFITSYNSSSSTTSSSSNGVDTNWISDYYGGGDEYKSSSQTLTSPIDHAVSAPQSSFSSSNSFNSGVVERLVDSPVGKVQIPDMFCENGPILLFNRGVEEASKFLPNENNLIINLENNGLSHYKPKIEANGGSVVKVEKKDDREHSPNGSRGKKNVHREDLDLEEGRSNKQSAVFSEETVRSAMFDMVLLCKGHKEQENANSTLRESLKTETNKNSLLNGNSKGSNGGKSRGKKQNGKKDVVDLRTLLIHCAQSVAADDRRSAYEQLKQIRQHSSPFGDGTQRLAHCFADGLEARLAGNGSQIYATLMNKRTPAADILKAYQLYLAACPFKKITNFFSNQTIMNLAENATTLHIVDLGIHYGFQWPCLIERLSARRGGPPKLRITGIDFPQPGFRPAQRVEETGLRLANYAESFNVPFEYNAIAQKWETIQIEDLKIKEGEVLVVNSLYRFRNLLDETVVLDSPRNAVLNLVRKMNPDIFIQGVVNGAYNAPFFVTRFREALFHFSALFDTLEANVPREHPERIILEKYLFGREALNVIACEGSERVERPETYKQWQVRNLRAGFTQLPLDKEIMNKGKDRVKSFYHKDFVIDKDGQWMLQGWKGRIIYAISSWKPV